MAFSVLAHINTPHVLSQPYDIPLASPPLTAVEMMKKKKFSIYPADLDGFICHVLLGYVLFHIYE